VEGSFPLHKGRCPTDAEFHGGRDVELMAFQKDCRCRRPAISFGYAASKRLNKFNLNETRGFVNGRRRIEGNPVDGALGGRRKSGHLCVLQVDDDPEAKLFC
jgi:hypothetical protein